MKELPQIRKDNGIFTLYVEGQPFQAFAGEVHNSAAYDLEKIETEVWKRMEQSHLNTLIVPVYWETLEPEDGIFDFSLVDGLMQQAQRYKKKLILLWFGLWKNAESAYVPAWMKKDSKTYFRAEMYGGGKLNTISPLCTAAIERDADAFSALMEHIRKTDQNTTVIMVQVENEVGLLGTERDYCPQAEEKFRESVPAAILRDQAGSSGITWKKAFGDQAEEIFSAWCFASALEQIASAGKEKYPIPYYANVWLKQFPWYPGSYPSGGPVEDMLWVWKTAAPSLSAVAPDIYVPYVPEIMEKYSRTDNPLLIPEVRKDVVTASYAMYAYLNHHALCYAPFGIEDLWQDVPAELPEEVIDTLKMDPLSFDLSGTKETLGEVYRILEEIKPFYLKYRGTQHMKCFLKRAEGELGCYLKFSSCDIEIQYLPQTDGTPASAGAVFELEENKFLVVGMMCSIRFHTKPGDHRKIDFLRKESGTFQDGKWVCAQRQNGDEKIESILYDLPGCFEMEIFRY